MIKNSFFSNSIKQLVFVTAILIGNIVQAQWTQTSQSNIYSPASGTLSMLGDFGGGTDNNGVEYIAYTELLSGSNSTWDFVRVKKLNPSTKEWESFGTTYASSIKARHPKLAFDSNNNLYLAFIEMSSNTFKIVIKKYDTSTQTWINAFGTSESPVVGVMNQSLSNQNNAFDFDFTGLVPLVGMQTTHTSPLTVNIYTYNGSAWQSSLTNSSNYNGTYFDLAKNGNRVYFFYPNSSNNIQGAYYESGAWSALTGSATLGAAFIPKFTTKFYNSDIYIAALSNSNNNKFAKLFKYSSNTYSDISSPNFSTVGNSIDAFHFDITPQGDILAAYCNASTTPAYGYTALKYTSNSWTTLACGNFTYGSSEGGLPNARTINIKALSNSEYIINTRSSSSANIGLSFVYNPPTAPAISSFTPTSGSIGSTVTITGTNFSCASAVSFNGTNATSFTVNSATSITATVPTGATTGTIAITTPGGSVTSSSNFTVVPAPTISSFTPTSGGIGTTITITGTNLTGTTAVSFNGTAATTFTVVSSTSITATVPTGSTTGIISVTTPGGTATSGSSFTVIPAPTISSFTPSSSTIGATVTITGTNFTGATAVRFNGIAATTYSVVSATSITATVPTGASTGTIAVTTAGGTATSASSLTLPVPPPTITSFSPTNGFVGSTVTISGTGFDSTPNNNVVLLDGMRCTITSASSTSLSVIIPKGTTHNNFQVINVSNKLSVISKMKFVTKSLTLGAQVVANSFYLNTPASLNNIVVTNTKNYSTADIDADGKIDILAMNNGYSLKIAATSSTPSSLN
jgi:hypothetical protein